MSTEPVLADAPLPIAAFNELVVLDALITVDFETWEPLMLIAPVLAEAFSPIAAFSELVVWAALISVDFSILEPSAHVVPAATVKVRAATTVCNVFMSVSSMGFWLVG
jgi:hypothetical protein